MTTLVLALLAGFPYIESVPNHPVSTNESWFVWCGECSRSLREDARYSSAAEACARAEVLKAEFPNVFILNGRSNVETVLAIWRFSNGYSDKIEHFKQCSLWTKACGTEWVQDRSLSEKTAQSAEAKAAAIRRGNGAAFVIYELESE